MICADRPPQQTIFGSRRSAGPVWRRWGLVSLCRYLTISSERALQYTPPIFHRRESSAFAEDSASPEGQRLSLGGESRACHCACIWRVCCVD